MIEGEYTISAIAFALVLLAMFGIEKKRSYGQVLMFLSQIFWLTESVQKHNLWLGIQSVVLGVYTMKVWWTWHKSERSSK